METRLKKCDTKAKSCLTCGPLSHLYMVDCNMSKGHRSGGLAILWNDVIQINFLQSNNTLIDMYIIARNLDISWYTTGIYGYPYASKKHLTCVAINELAQNRTTSKWLIFGDFNLVLNSSEKLGGNPIEYNLTKLFNDTFNACDLYDLGYCGNKFTWVNNQTDNIHIKERIDRYCANTNWISCFPRYSNKHLLRYTSDHNPILLEFFEEGECWFY
jgi:hypothetical protein